MQNLTSVIQQEEKILQLLYQVSDYVNVDTTSVLTRDNHYFHLLFSISKYNLFFLQNKIVREMKSAL